jgi:hypothetical protein
MGLRQQQEEGARRGCGYWQQEVEGPGSFEEELLGETELEAARIPWGEEEEESPQFAARKENH